MITVLGILGGAVLGTRYKVLCLVPATVIGIAAIAALDLMHMVAVSSVALTAVMLAVGLQIGYLIGVTVRLVLLAAPARGVARLAPAPRHEQPARIF
jgi:hypothetical protein